MTIFLKESIAYSYNNCIFTMRYGRLTPPKLVYRTKVRQSSSELYYPISLAGRMGFFVLFNIIFPSYSSLIYFSGSIRLEHIHARLV